MKTLKTIIVVAIVALLTLLCGCNPIASPQNGDDAMKVSAETRQLI